MELKTGFRSNSLKNKNILKMPLTLINVGPPLKMGLGPKSGAKVNQHSPAHHPLDGMS